MQRLREQSSQADEGHADAAKAETSSHDTADTAASKPPAGPDNDSAEAVDVDADDKTDKAD